MCSSIGFWSSGSTCSDVPNIEVVTNTGNYNVGSQTGISPCPETDNPLPPGFYNNGVDIIYVEYTGVSASTFVISVSSCTPGDFCIINTSTLDGDYFSAGTYNSNSYFTGSTGFIFYSSGETRWCLSSTLGGVCEQFGPYASSSIVPDLDDTVMYVGPCVTTTTTTDPCATFDFDAIFDCLVPVSPSPTPTNSPTPTPTPTPSTSNPCGGVSLLATASGYTPTPTPTNTPTPSPSPEVTRPCNFSGEVIFNAFSETLECANSKKFKDCFTGIDYFTSSIVLVSGTTSPKEGYVYNATINGQGYCVVYEGLFENISGNDTISLTTEIGASVDGACLNCTPNLTATPTPTPTTTPTPTPSSTPCLSFQYIIENQSPSLVKFPYIDCVGNQNLNLPAFSSNIICASVVPTSTSPNITITPVGSACL